MVNSFYVFNLYKNLDINLKSKRRIKIFFAGRFDKKSYQKPEIKNFFNKINRISLLDLLKNEFSKDLLIPISHEQIKRNNKPILIVDRDRTNIAPHELPDYLKNSNFFLALPGVVMPLCHNIIEAMAFGVIPILQHPELFHPPLIDGETCFSFNSEKDFFSTTSKALKTSDAEIFVLRKKVLAYYNSYLSPQAAIANLVTAKAKYSNLFLIAEYQSVKRIKKN